MKPKASLVFVDEIEETAVRLLLDEDAFYVPRGLLPDEAREGQWLLLTLAPTAAPPDETSALRRRLGRGDPGGDIEL